MGSPGELYLVKWRIHHGGARRTAKLALTVASTILPGLIGGPRPLFGVVAPALNWVDQSELTTLSLVTPFASSDVFNTPIAADPEIDPDSARWVMVLERDAAAANLANNVQWGIPVYETTPSDPTYALTGSVYYTGDYFLTRIPRAAVASTGADHHLVVLGDGIETDFWGFSRSSNGTPQAWSIWQNFCGPFSSSGQCQSQLGNAGAANATRLALLAGLVRPPEIAAGNIEHALAFTIPQTALGFRAPAAGSDRRTPGGIPEGVRIQLDPSYQIPASMPLWIATICRALQRYGAILTDSGGTLAFYGESPLTGSWPAGVGGSLASVPWSQMRVIAG
jgi:hypothetical protein